jgi:hypothetical protein
MTLELSAPPAHKVWVDLVTRITSQDLHFRSGQEEAAVKSIVDVFRSTRELMKESPGADEFVELADAMLKTIRPYTARWHGLLDADGKFIGPQARRHFRSELIELQPQLAALAELFKSLSQRNQVEVPAPAEKCAPRLGARVPLGIGQSRSRPANAQEIDLKEREHVAGRRGERLVRKQEVLFDGVGLALSGGGIRSATFCLGVVQVMAAKKLLPKFDYLSTVSGGGYFGSFLTNQFTDKSPNPEDIGDGFDPTAEESAPVRHLRNSSKYLLPKTTLETLKLAGVLLSGVLATTLLVLVVPVFAALLVHLIGRTVGLDAPVRVLFLSMAGVAGLFVVACWLFRPAKWMTAGARSVLDNVAVFFSLFAAAVLVVALTPWALETLNKLDSLEAWKSWKVAGFSLASLTTLITGAGVVKAMRVAWKYKKAISRLFMFSGIVLFTIVYLWVVDTLGLARAESWTLTGAEIVVLVALAAWVIWALSININETGLHRYYRDKLATCYLDAQTSVRTVANPPPLTRLSERLPYHLINTTVNLTSAEDPELRGRGGDFFLLSKFYCGSPLMQYKETSEVEQANWDMNLATAMAISGAAASTNMGWQTMREYRTLMAIFNVRLGYWMKWKEEKSVLRSNAFVQIMREIFGSLSESSTTINLSDGGHIENLAAYELIRRKMRFIVCVDGGMDATMTCADLNRLQRLVAIDFGYRMEFDAARLQLQPKYSSDYGMLVKIDYTPNEEHVSKQQLGWMLYIKLAMLGTESSYVLDYQRENPHFPHQTTGDQFFDEAQFEAYRKLGETAANNFFAAPFATPSPDAIAAGKGFDLWFTSLAQHMLKDTDSVFS